MRVSIVDLVELDKVVGFRVAPYPRRYREEGHIYARQRLTQNVFFHAVAWVAINMQLLQEIY